MPAKAHYALERYLKTAPTPLCRRHQALESLQCREGAAYSTKEIKRATWSLTSEVQDMTPLVQSAILVGYSQRSVSMDRSHRTGDGCLLGEDALGTKSPRGAGMRRHAQVQSTARTPGVLCTTSDGRMQLWDLSLTPTLQESGIFGLPLPISGEGTCLNSVVAHQDEA